MSDSGKRRIQEAIKNRAKLASVVKDQIRQDLKEKQIRQWYDAIVKDGFVKTNSPIDLESIPKYFKSFGIPHQLVATRGVELQRSVVVLGYTGGYFEILIIMIGPKDYVPIAEIFEPASISQGKVFDGIYVLSTIE